MNIVLYIALHQIYLWIKISSYEQYDVYKNRIEIFSKTTACLTQISGLTNAKCFSVNNYEQLEYCLKFTVYKTCLYIFPVESFESLKIKLKVQSLFGWFIIRFGYMLA